MNHMLAYKYRNYPGIAWFVREESYKTYDMALRNANGSNIYASINGKPYKTSSVSTTTVRIEGY